MTKLLLKMTKKISDWNKWSNCHIKEIPYSVAISVIVDGVKEGMHNLVIEYESVMVSTGMKIEPMVNFHRRWLRVSISYLSPQYITWYIPWACNLEELLPITIRLVLHDDRFDDSKEVTLRNNWKLQDKHIPLYIPW